MTKAQAKFIRMSPRKLRRVINEVRGKSAAQAQVILKFMPYSAARVVEKVLKSAVANAKENEKIDPETLKVTKAFVDQANTLKRWRPMSRGRGYSIFKRSSHVTIEVNPSEDIKESQFKYESGSGKTRKQVQGHKKHDHAHDQDHDHDYSSEVKESKKSPKAKSSKAEEKSSEKKTKKSKTKKEDKE